MRRALAVLSFAFALIASSAFQSAPAVAYGSDAVYQVTFSLNCVVDPHNTYLVVQGSDFPLPATSGHYSFTLERGFFGQFTVQRIPGR